MLRLHLPPNLVSALMRDAVAVRLEVDLSREPELAVLPALALLQRWSGTPTPPALLQLTRSQLRELLGVLVGQPVFCWVNRPGVAIPWREGQLEGVSEHLGRGSVTAAAGGASKAGVSATASAPVRARGEAATPATIDGSEHFISIALPSREHGSYGPLLELVKAHGFVLEPSNRRWWLRDRHKTLSFLAEYGERLRAEWEVRPTENFERNTAKLARVELVCSAEESRGGFSLTMALRAGGAPEEAIRGALSGERAYVEHGGRTYLMDRALMGRVTAAQRALSGDPKAGLVPTRSLRIRSAQVAEAQELLDGLSPSFQAPATWIERSRSLRELKSLRPAPLPPSLGSLLRPYQQLGAAWLWYLHGQELGGILADEMGLGKTLQALGLLSALGQDAGPSLVVAPASLLENWRREAARFAPGLRLFVHHASHRLAAPDQARAFDVVLTSYGTLARDRELFASVEWTCAVADEAQHIKNRRSQNASALRSARARSRFLLTGTPLENSLEDLRSLFEYLMPGYLTPPPPGLRADERAWHDERLVARTAPYILRRTKRSVAPELPPRIEQTLWCEMEADQAALYRSVNEACERELMGLEAAGASEARLRFAMLTQLLRLRQVCCDPRLLEPQFAADAAKREALLELLGEAIDDGHRVLVFSQFASALRLLKEDLAAEGVACCHLDGSMSAKVRQAEIDRFQADSSVPVFLLSLKAGGTGLNLTGADTVVHFDPWWNPAAEAQATDRAHRIGQTRTVTSYKLICSGTVEEKVLALQDTKRALLAEVFEASDAAAARLSLDDLRGLLGR